jgi:hypothetical protein
VEGLSAASSLRTDTIIPHRVATGCVSYRCSVPVCVVLVYTLCTKSMDKLRIVEICIRAVIMFLVSTIYEYLRIFFSGSGCC